MRHTKHPVAKPLSLAVAAALTGFGLAMVLVTPAQADTIVSISQSNGIQNTSPQNITITSSGTILAGQTGIANSSTIGTLNNSGTISAGSFGISNNSSQIGTLGNSGTIYGGTYGIVNSGTIGTLSNNGSISGGHTGIANNAGTIGTLSNSGTISGTINGINNENGMIGTLINTGSISVVGPGMPSGILNSGTINIINNSGFISGGYTGIQNSTGSIGTLSNSGTISGGTSGIVNGSGIINVLNNNSAGTITSFGYAISNTGTIITLNNNGSISTTGYYALSNGGMIATLNNGGYISGYTGIDNYNAGTIGVLINTGSISSVNNAGTITTLINTGSISSVNNTGTITTLTNGQSTLSYVGNLPTNYNTYFASGSSYGAVVFSSSGSTSYGIQLAPAGVTLLANHVYTSVLSSSSAFTVVNAGQQLSYSANGYSVTYELVAESVANLAYDLDILSFSYVSGGSGGSGNVASGISPAVIAQHNSPAYYAARVIDANSTLSNLFSGVSGTAAQSAAASQSLPLVIGGATSVTQTALTSVNTIIDARQSANRGASSGDDFQTNRNMWLKAFGTEADQSDLNGVSGFKAHTGGVTFGADQKVTDTLTLGAAFAYVNSNVSSTVGGASHGINIKGYQLIGYGSLALNNRDSVDFQLDGGMSNNSGTRDISFADVVASSSYNSWTAHLGSSLNRRYDLSDRLTLTPSLRVDYTRINENGYQESGAGDFDLNVDSQRAEALVFGVDGKLDYKLSDTLALAANLGVGYDAMNKQDSIIAAYAGAPNASFITYGLNQGALVSRAGAMLSYKLPKGMEISAHYDVEGRRNYLSQTASVKFSMPF